MLRLDVEKTGIFWEASVDVGPTMSDRSANVEVFASLSKLETVFEGLEGFSCSWIAGRAVL